MQNIQCADFVLRCLNKTAPDVFHDHIENLDHQKATKANGRNLKIPKVKTEIAKRILFQCTVCPECKNLRKNPLYHSTVPYDNE